DLKLDLLQLFYHIFPHTTLPSSVVKIASQLAKSDELTFSPRLSELTRAQTRRRRGSLQDCRSASQNRGNAVRSDPGHERRDEHAF
ncbi:hypothetical protein A2U01_0043604, partial [Trifolium medium]|nr:hypothetical protein [Trifolium medium]